MTVVALGVVLMLLLTIDGNAMVGDWELRGGLYCTAMIVGIGDNDP